MVGVGNRLGNLLPGIVPFISVFVHEDTHQFRNRQCRMGIVDVNRNLIGEVVQCSVVSEVVADDVLAGRGNHEVLLLQAEFLSFFNVVCRIENLGNQMGAVFLLCGPAEVSVVEGGHIKVCVIGGFTLPESQCVYDTGIGAGDQHVVRNGVDDFGIVQVVFQAVIGPVLIIVAVKADFEGIFIAAVQPDIAARQPVVRKFSLPAVDDLLLEEAVFVADGESDSVVAL